MAWRKSVLFPLLQHLRYASLVLIYHIVLVAQVLQEKGNNLYFVTDSKCSGNTPIFFSESLTYVLKLPAGRCYKYVAMLAKTDLSLFIRPFEKRTYYAVAMSVRPSVRVFRTFLQHALRYQFETCFIYSVGGTTCRVWIASQLGHFDLVYSEK